ncbi:MAG: type II secretion system protein [Pseudomonadota bacterium]
MILYRIHPGPYKRSGVAHDRGFSLVEMAIVLIIVGLALGAGLSALSGQIEQKKINETQKVLEEARDALMGFAIVNGRLPRPATVAANTGVEIANCASEAACTGLIPWSTLGVTKLDGWGKIIRYSVTPAFANAAFNQGTAGTKNVWTRVNGGPISPTAVAANVPAVVFSHGRDNFGTTDGGGAIPNTAVGLTNTDEINNDTGTGTGPLGTNFVQRPPSTNTVAPGVFDDMVVWLPRPTLFARLGAAGRTIPTPPP